MPLISSNAAIRTRCHPSPSFTTSLLLLSCYQCELAHNDLKKVARQRSQLRCGGTVVALIAAFLHARGQDWRAPPNSFPFPLFQQARSLGVWFLMGGCCDTASRLKDREDGGWRAGELTQSARGTHLALSLPHRKGRPCSLARLIPPSPSLSGVKATANDDCGYSAKRGRN